MKVISGKFKGRLIEINSKNNFRPTLSRIREDLFNLLEHNSKLNVELESAIFCDLFCGSGSIGIEALSRGAKKVIFNDIEYSNIEPIKEFLQKTKTANFEIFNINGYNQKNEMLEECDILYLDPPYDHDLSFLEENLFNQISKNCLVILECNQRFIYQNILVEKNYKNKKLYFIKKFI
jgi:16S rRNA (guanine966-N2)-methyltransferase